MWSGHADAAGLAQQTEAVAAELRHAGNRPFVVPFGGSNGIAARGYAECAQELLAQVPDVSTAVVALGSGGTMAGLVSVLGTQRVLGVHCGAIDDPRGTVAGLLSDMGVDVDPADLRLDVEQVGAGYGQLTDPSMAAMLTCARTEGVVLDPIYTGRTLAGLIAAIATGQISRGEEVVFAHTGGMPGLFGSADATAQAVAALRVWTAQDPCLDRRTGSRPRQP